VGPASNGELVDELDRTVDEVVTASRALLGVVARSVAPVLDRVTVPQFRVLVILSTSDGAVRSGDLAVALGVHPSTFTRTADRLVSAGWVRRAENPDNRRETLIELTPDGAGLVDQVTDQRRQEIRSILARVEPVECDLISQAMTVFAAAAGEPQVRELLALGV
jgi:DNA-binding MarR family transcriptional regulator